MTPVPDRDTCPHLDVHVRHALFCVDRFQIISICLLDLEREPAWDTVRVNTPEGTGVGCGARVRTFLRHSWGCRRGSSWRSKSSPSGQECIQPSKPWPRCRCARKGVCSGSGAQGCRLKEHTRSNTTRVLATPDGCDGYSACPPSSITTWALVPRRCVAPTSGWQVERLQPEQEAGTQEATGGATSVHDMSFSLLL